MSGMMMEFGGAPPADDSGPRSVTGIVMELAGAALTSKAVYLLYCRRGTPANSPDVLRVEKLILHIPRAVGDNACHLGRPAQRHCGERQEYQLLRLVAG